MATKTVRLSNFPVPPGEFLAEELNARGISREEMAARLDASPETLNEIISGDRAITPLIAEALQDSLGLAALFWLNSEARYRLTLANNLEIYGTANPFDGPESDWPDTDVETETNVPLSSETVGNPGD